MLNLSKQAILAAEQPEDLFTMSSFHHDFMRLRKKWHPDYDGDASVFKHLVEMGEIGRERIKTGTWGGKSLLVIYTTDLKKFNLRYKKHHEIEIGDMYIGDTNIAFIIESSYKDLYENAIKAIRSVKYPNKAFREEFEKYVPKIKFNDTLEDGRLILILEKTTRSVLLQDFIEFLPDQKQDPKHTAWVIGSLYNLAAFFETIGVMQGGFTPQGLLVDPENHICYPYSWWFTTNIGKQITALPGQLLRILPKAVLKDKTAKGSFDRLALKAVGIYCLGDKSMVGSKLLMDKNVPNQMVTWVRSQSSRTAVEEYQQWGKLLKEMFGKRVFLDAGVTSKQIYR